MNIKRIVKNMQDFKEEVGNDFKDKETFWKHFYKKLDKEIYNEFQNVIKGENDEDKDFKEDVKNLMKEVFKTIDDSDMGIIEIEIKEKTT